MRTFRELCVLIFVASAFITFVFFLSVLDDSSIESIQIIQPSHPKISFKSNIQSHRDGVKSSMKGQHKNLTKIRLNTTNKKKSAVCKDVLSMGNCCSRTMNKCFNVTNFWVF